MSKLREAARGQSCVRCGACDDTVVLAHYTGPRQYAYGKGIAMKCSDLAGADLCMNCHAHFDRYETDNTWERSEEFLHLCMLTVIRRHAMGVIR